MVRWLLPFAVVGCGRIGFDPLDGLVVTRTDNRAEGGPALASIAELPAEGLSLREAITIANNHPGPDRITFDRDVFPVGAPAVIRIDRELELDGDDTEVDGTSRGVQLDAAPGFSEKLLEVEGTGVTLRALGFGAGGTKPRIVVEGDAATLVNLEFVGGPIAIKIENAADTKVADTNILTGSDIGISLEATTGATLENVRIDRVIGDPIFASNTSDLTIRACTIVISDKTLGRGIRLENTSRSFILDNLVDPGPAQLISMQDSSDNEIIGNVLDGGNVGIALFGTSSRNLMFRNVIMGSTDEAMFVDATAVTNRILNTTLFNAAAISDSAPDTQIANTLDATTGFVAPVTYDFRLVPGNPSIDQGTDLGLDMLPDSPERFLGAAPDLGAVESF